MLRYDVVVEYHADSRVSTHILLDDVGFGVDSRTGPTEIAEDGSFPVSGGFGQVTLHGKHLQVFVDYFYGDTVEFKGHLTERVPDWMPESLSAL